MRIIASASTLLLISCTDAPADSQLIDWAASDAMMPQDAKAAATWLGRDKGAGIQAGGYRFAIEVSQHETEIWQSALVESDAFNCSASSAGNECVRADKYGGVSVTFAGKNRVEIYKWSVT